METTTETDLKTRLLQIAQALGRLHMSKAGCEVDLIHLTHCIEARRLALVPLDGWPGKNEAERTAAREKACEADEVLARWCEDERTTRRFLIKTCAKIAALEAERRALEWIARLELGCAELDR